MHIFQRHTMQVFMLAALALSSTVPALAQPKTEGAKLAKETVKLIGLQEQVLVAAVRQKNDPSGRKDFQSFVVQPVDAMQDRWQTLPRAERLNFIFCITALQEFANHAADSFKAGRIGQPSSLLKESRTQCK